jgi:hypothetical protein
VPDSLEAALSDETFRNVEPTHYDAVFGQHGRAFRVPPALLKAIAKAESGFVADAICYNAGGATPCATYQPDRTRWDYGLMQINGRTAQSLGIDLNNLDELLVDWRLNIYLGARLIDENRTIADATRARSGIPPTGIDDWVSAYQWGLRNGKVVLPHPNPDYTRKVLEHYRRYRSPAVKVLALITPP